MFSGELVGKRFFEYLVSDFQLGEYMRRDFQFNHFVTCKCNSVEMEI